MIPQDANVSVGQNPDSPCELETKPLVLKNSSSSCNANKYMVWWKNEDNSPANWWKGRIHFLTLILNGYNLILMITQEINCYILSPS